MKHLLFTECLQNDFVAPIGPGASLPNALHVGRSESRRLLGAPDTDWETDGPMARFLKGWSTDRGPGHHAFHLRDWHDPADPQTNPTWPTSARTACKERTAPASSRRWLGCSAKRARIRW
jgi:hypothetical protein